MLRTVVDDPIDPFRISELSDGDLKQDPARLADEAASIAMLGGRRVVRIRGAADGTAKIFESFLSDPAGDALILVEAGELGPRSSLRALFENAKNAATIACYADGREQIESLIRSRLAAEGLAPEPDALDYLLQNLGSDRGVTQNELEKLILYAGPKAAADKPGEKRMVTLDDARASVGDNAGSSLDEVIDAAMTGDLDGLDTALARANGRRHQRHRHPERAFAPPDAASSRRRAPRNRQRCRGGDQRLPAAAALQPETIRTRTNAVVEPAAPRPGAGARPRGGGAMQIDRPARCFDLRPDAFPDCSRRAFRAPLVEKVGARSARR